MTYARDDSRVVTTSEMAICYGNFIMWSKFSA